MKKIGIFLLIIVVLIAGGYFTAASFVNTKGKGILLTNIKNNLGEDAQVDTLSLEFPFTVKITNFKCGDLFIKEADVLLGGYNPFNSEVTLAKVTIDGADLKVKIEKSGISAKPIFRKDFSKENSAFNFARDNFEIIPSAYAAQEVPQKVIPVKINNLYLIDSRVELTDFTRDVPLSFTFKDIKARVKNIVYPQLTKMNLDVKAALEAKDITMKEAVSAGGWVDYFNKNMDVDVTVKGINYFAFTDYYPSFLKPDKLGIKEAAFGLQGNVNSQNNEMIIELVFSGMDYVKQEGSPQNNYLNTIIALLKGNKLRIKTKMDSPKFDFASIKDSLKGAAGDIGAKVIINEVVNKITDTAQNSEETGDSDNNRGNKTAETINSVIDTFKGIFKKD